METIGSIIEQAVMSSFAFANEDGTWKVQVRSDCTGRYNNITAGPARLVTNCPGAVALGEVTTERGGDRRRDESWETSFRTIRIGQVPEGGFVAYATTRTSTGCKFSGGDYLVPLEGEVPVLQYGTAYAQWAEQMDEEAYRFLVRFVEGHGRDLHTLRFATGRACSTAPHAHRRGAWKKFVLSVWGPEGLRLLRSVRTATVKVALMLGWKPSIPQPERWEGLPEGVVEIALG